MAVSTNHNLGGHVIQLTSHLSDVKNYRGFQGYSPFQNETQYFGLEFPMTLERLWRNVEFVKQVPGQLNQLEMWVDAASSHIAHFGHRSVLLGHRFDYLVIRDYFSKYLIVRRLHNSSTHAVIKELGLVFTELGRTILF